MPRGDKQAIMRFEIPVPEINVQRKVAQSLAAFERLTQDLEYGIPAEIIARRKQKEFYRNMLLAFKEQEAV